MRVFSNVNPLCFCETSLGAWVGSGVICRTKISISKIDYEFFDFKYRWNDFKELKVLKSTETSAPIVADNVRVVYSVIIRPAVVT